MSLKERSTSPAILSKADAFLFSAREMRLRSRLSRRSRLLFLGGEPMDGPRHIWWNFVSSSRERIDQAKEDWAQRRFDIVPGDEQDFIPLPR